jgi:c-di-GMP-related signal transduction protein
MRCSSWASLLLDKLFSEPFEQLLGVLNVPERVQDTLIGGRGPYVQDLRIAQAVEQGPTESLPDLLSMRFFRLSSAALQRSGRW